MRPSWSCLIAIIASCNIATALKAQQTVLRPGMPGYSEAASAAAAEREKAEQLFQICEQKYIFRKATATSNAMKLLNDSCKACSDERRRYGEALERLDELIYYFSLGNGDGKTKARIASTRENPSCWRGDTLNYAARIIESRRDDE